MEWQTTGRNVRPPASNKNPDLRYFHSFHGILLWLQKELRRSGTESMLKITKKNIQGMIKTILFLFLFPILQLFNRRLFRFFSTIYSEKLKIAGNSSGGRHILTTLQLVSQSK